MGIRKFFVNLVDLIGPPVDGYILIFQANITKYGYEPVKQGKYQTKSSYWWDLQSQVLDVLIKELFK